jgi:drug/metabolite transporter (DMT)-like permease
MTTAALLVLKKRKTAWYFLLMALASLMWSGQGTAVKILDRQLGPIAITFLPFFVTTLFFIFLLLRMRRANPNVAKPSLQDWIQFVVAGVAGQVLAQLGMTWGISKSLASNGAILNLLIPVISAVLASLMLKERESSFGQMRFLTGNILIFGGCLGSSFYNVYCKGLMHKFKEIEILIFSYITASIASIPLFIWVEPFHFRVFLTLDWKSWAAFAFLAFFMYGASMLLFFKALQHLDVTTASTSLYLVPVFGVVLAFVLLGEHLNPLAVLGAAVVLGATLLVMKYDTSY